MNLRILVEEVVLLVVIAGGCLTILVALEFLYGAVPAEPMPPIDVKEYVKKKGDELLFDEQGHYLQLKEEEEGELL